MKNKESAFNRKLKELVNEFNSLGLRLKATGEDFGVHDFFLVLDTTKLYSEDYCSIYYFVKKYRATVGISPVRTNDCMCIRIDDDQFNLK
jgi:hypothetical protein